MAPASGSPPASPRRFRRPLALLTGGLLALFGGGTWGLAEAQAEPTQAVVQPAFPFNLGPLLPPAPLGPSALICPAPTDPLELALWRVTTERERPDYSCQNAFIGYLRTPRPEGGQDAFDLTAGQIRAARSEVLVASMEWHAGEGHPGGTFAGAVSDLYARVKADPGAYPQGMTVRVVLGGFPDLGRVDWASYALAIVRDLRALGVPMNDLAVGWHLGVANYRYFPHSHVKLHVIDGQDLTVAGYNYTDYHLPSPVGGDLHDLGLRLRGPVAQDGVAVFDDLWRKARQVRCPEGVSPDAVARACTLGESDPPTHPAAARLLTPAGTARAFLLYRRPGFDQAERAQLALYGAARQGIDVMQNEFSPVLRCWYAYLQPDACPPDTWPVYMGAMLGAMERGVRVRVLLVDYGIDRDANRSGVALMRLAARRRGLEDRFEARYVTFPMHTKAVAVDGRVVLAGSMNFHFSAWGNLGLNEAMLATSDPAAVAEQAASFEDVWRNHSRPVPQEWWMRNVEVGSPWPVAPEVEPGEKPTREP